VTALDQAPDQGVPFGVRLRRDTRGVVLQIVGEVDLRTGDRFHEALEEAMENRPQVLVVDLTGATFLGSLTWSYLISAARTSVLRIVPGPVAPPQDRARRPGSASAHVHHRRRRTPVSPRSPSSVDKAGFSCEQATHLHHSSPRTSAHRLPVQNAGSGAPLAYDTGQRHLRTAGRSTPPPIDTTASTCPEPEVQQKARPSINLTRSVCQPSNRVRRPRGIRARNLAFVRSARSGARSRSSCHGPVFAAGW